MKKLLTVLLTVLMACSILTVNVFAEEGEEIVAEEQTVETIVEEEQEEPKEELEEKPMLAAAPLAAPSTRTVDIGIVVSDYGTGSGGLIARECQLKGTVTVEVSDDLIDTFGNFELEDIQDAIIQKAKEENFVDTEKYKVLWFGQYYEENIRTCSIWDYVGLFSGKQIKNIVLDTKKCYLVFEKIPTPTAPQPSDAKAAADLTGNGTNQKLLAEPYPTVDEETCKVVYSVDGKVWSESVPEAKEPGNYTVYYRTEAKDGTSFKPSEAKYVEVEIKEPIPTMTAHFYLVKSEYGLGPLKDVAWDCSLLNEGKPIEVADVPLKTNLGISYYYRLTDATKELGVSEALVDAVKANCPDGYEFLMFGQSYAENILTVRGRTNTCGAWTLRDIFIPPMFKNGDQIRNHNETEKCYIVYVKKDVEPLKSIPTPTGAVAATLTYDGTSQQLLDASSNIVVNDPDVEGETKGVDYKITYSLNGIDGWTEDPTAMVATEAGDHTVYYRAEPITGSKYDDQYYQVSENAVLTVTIDPFEAEEKDGDNGNTSVEITGPNEDGTKVEFEITVELPDGDKTIKSDDPDFDDFFEVKDGSDEPTKFGENELVLSPKGNLSGDDITVTYDVGHVADEYEAWDKEKTYYSFPVDVKEGRIVVDDFYYYTVTTTEGYVATVVGNIANKAVAVHDYFIPKEALAQPIRVIPTPQAKIDYYFAMGDRTTVFWKYIETPFSDLLRDEIVDNAQLIVYSESAFETGETDEKHDGKYVYEGTDTDAEVGEKDVIKFIIEPAEEIIDEGINKTYTAIGTVDAYLVLYRWNEEKGEVDDTGVRVELKNKSMIKIVVKELFKNAFAKLDIDDPLEKGYRREFAIFHIVNGKPQLKTIVDADDVVTYWTDSCSYFTLAYKNVKNNPYVPVKTGVE